MDEARLNDLERNAVNQEKEGAIAQVTAHNILELIREHRELWASIQDLADRNRRLHTRLRKEEADTSAYEPVPYGEKENGVTVYAHPDDRTTVVYANHSTHTEISLPAGWVVCKKREDTS